MNIFVGITGASGPVIGLRLIEELLSGGHRVLCAVSEAGAKNISFEVLGEGNRFSSVGDYLKGRGVVSGGRFSEFADGDLFAPPASGTSIIDAVVVAPCSMRSLAAVAGGLSDSLITRAADVALKEARPCVLVPRETPLSLIHLENMCRAKRAGAHILVPAVAYYNSPVSISDVTDFFVGRILNLLGIDHSLFRPWGDM